eukprot:TRINITY_DN423_c0_g2_i1.p1 TRINITY_DN423_c0_g2~~TRINITY_DN423_c0_g2_i1.p1  ORF type:complete len:839 (+),score=125.03 TRINITY_DN423_c0_g2_i1:41-2557(+)
MKGITPLFVFFSLILLLSFPVLNLAGDAVSDEDSQVNIELDEESIRLILRANNSNNGSSENPCSSYTDCNSCVSDSLCGYCSTTGECLEGSDSGPTIDGTCPGGFLPPGTQCSTGNPFGLVAIFTAEGTRIQVFLDTPVDRSSIGGLFYCSQILDSATVLKIGLDARCFFQDLRTLIIRLQANATILPGDTITIPSQSIPFTGPNAALGKRALNLRPVSGQVSQNGAPSPPVVQIIGSTFISPSNFITLDGSTSYGAAGRPFVNGYTWTLRNPNALSVNLANYVATQNGPVLQVPNSLLLATQTYIISLTVTNWVGLTSTGEITIFVGREIREEIYSNISSTVYTHADNPLSLRAFSTSPTLCTGNPNISPLCSNGPRSFAWRRTNGTVWENVGTVTLGTSLSNTLTIPQNTLVGGTNYTVTVTSISNASPQTAFLADPLLSGGPKGVGRNSYNLVVSTDSLIAVISGGDIRNQSYMQSLQLNGNDSLDPNNTPGTLNYRWSCTKIGSGTNVPNGRCYANDYFALPQYQVAYVELPQFALEPGRYVFYLDVFKNDSFGVPLPTSRAQVIINLYWRATPSSSIDVFDTEAGTRNYPRPIANHRLVLSGSSRPSTNAYVTNYTWLLVAGDFALDNSFNINDSSLILPAGTLTPGASYTFGLIVDDSNTNLTDENADRGYSEISFITDDSPHGGSCSISPNSGSQYTEFYINCINFSDQLRDYPLFYNYFISTPDGSTTFPLSTGYIPSGALASLFPTSYSGPIEVFYQVTDRLGATDPFLYSAGTINVVFDQNAQPIFDYETNADIVNTVYQTSLDVFNSGRVENIAQLIYSLLTRLNAG